MLKNYFQTAFRNLFRNKIYSSINILGLSLGLAAAMLIILYVKDELSYDRFHAQLDHIYSVGMERIDPGTKEDQKSSITGVLQGPHFAAKVPEIRAFVRLVDDRRDIKQGNEVKSQAVQAVDSNFFSVFSFPLLSGNPKTALLEPHSTVITEEFSRQQFGNVDALGKTIMVKNDSDQFVPYVVSGVAKKIPQNSSVKFEMLVPIQVNQAEAAQGDSWFTFYLNTFVVLAPGANVKLAESKMNKVYIDEAGETIKMMAKNYGDSATTIYSLHPFKEMHLSKDFHADNGLVGASNPIYSYILSGIALFILIIACINFVNLTIARSVKRAKEIGIRKVVGGNRKQLIFQFLGESFILCFIAFVLALLLAQLALPVFNELANKSLSLVYLLDLKLVAGYTGLFIITSLLAGFYPAWILSDYSPVQTLYSRFMLAGKNYLQKSLVVLQFTLATFLIISTLIIYAQFNHLTNEKLGYDDSNLVKVDLNGHNTPRSLARLFKDELLKSPAIEAVANKNAGFWGTAAKVNGETQLMFAYETVDEDFIPMMKIPVIQGRNFSKDLPTDSTHSVLVNETFVKKAGWKSPLGQIVDFWYHPGEKYTVVGVVKDHHFESLTKEIGPQLFTMKASNTLGTTFIRLKPHNETAALKYLQKIYKQNFPTSPYSYVFRDQENLKNYEAEARWKEIMFFSAVLTIFISCIGLFGLSVLTAEKRTKEVGIRKVLGASVSGVVALLSKDFLKLVVLSLLIAIPLAWMASARWLQNYPYRITLNAWLFLLAALLVSLIALVTVSFHAVKTAMASPARSLRSE